MEINRKLKSIYFQWATESCDQRWQWDDTFEKYLQYIRYPYDENFLKNVIIECDLLRSEFTAQVILITESFYSYCDQQRKRAERKNKRKWNRYCAKCIKEGVAPF